MAVRGILLIVASSSLCIYLILTLSKLLKELWLNPIRIQKLLASQGIKGPSYKFMYGSAKDLAKMRMEATAKPMALGDHDILPVLRPEVYLWSKKFGRKYVTWYGSKAMLVVLEPELIKEVLVNKDGAYSKAKIVGGFKKILGNGVATSNGEEWVKQRKLANHAFNSESVKDMMTDMVASMDMLLERWKLFDGREVDVYNEFRLFTAEVISRAAFGSSYKEGKNIFDMLMKSTSIMRSNILKIMFPLISKIWRNEDEIELEKLMKEVNQAVIEIVNQREEKVKNREMDNFGTDFLGILLNAYHDSDDSRRISLQDLIDECKTFYIGGQETTNSLLTWIVLLLAIHTDWQEQARNEVIDIFGHVSPNPDGLANLKIVNMIINETLRLYPPIVGALRSVEREVHLGDTILPANINVFISILAVHHDTRIWGQDAHIFRPDRFSEGVAKATNNNIAAFIPFVLGPRICVGVNFAMTEAKIALSMILQHYSFTLSPTYVHWPQDELTLRPRHGLQVILHRLQN